MKEQGGNTEDGDEAEYAEEGEWVPIADAENDADGMDVDGQDDQVDETEHAGEESEEAEESEEEQEEDEEFDGSYAGSRYERALTAVDRLQAARLDFVHRAV